jgi:hypothetical protein
MTFLEIGRLRFTGWRATAVLILLMTAIAITLIGAIAVIVSR